MYHIYLELSEVDDDGDEVVPAAPRSELIASTPNSKSIDEAFTAILEMLQTQLPHPVILRRKDKKPPEMNDPLVKRIALEHFG